MLTIDIDGIEEWKERLSEDRFLRAISTGMDRAGILAVGDIQARRLTKRGRHSLGIQSGRLRGSLTHTRPTILGKSVSTLVGTNVFYGAIHEYGDDEERIIRPKNGKALSFKIGGKTIIRKSVTRGPIPARQWLSRGLKDASHFFTSEIEKELLEEMNR